VILQGMNKLLQRLPDSSREEVRNQAIVFVQQLTASNEEMKKTVVFNEVSLLYFYWRLDEPFYSFASFVNPTFSRVSRFCLKLFMVKEVIVMVAWLFKTVFRSLITCCIIVKRVNAFFMVWAQTGYFV
jgi:hypothetical protein